MNREQRNQLGELCKRFSSEKVIAWADAHYQGQPWDTTMVDIFSVDNFIQVTTRAFKQLNEITIGEDYSVYAWDYTHPTLGAANLATEATNVLTGIEEKKPATEFVHHVQWIIKYLFDFDLWNKERATLNISDLEEKEATLLILTERVKGEFQKLEQAKNEYIAEKASIIKERETLTQFVEQKKLELATIAEAVPTVTNQKGEIDAIHKGVQQVDSDIRTVQKNHSDLYEQLKTQKETQEKEFKTITDKVEEEKVKLTAVISSGDEKVKFFQSLEQFIKDKQKEIIELGALAAGAALGGTFGLREKKLNDGLKFWKWAVPGITIIAMLWVIIVFTCLKSSTGTIWVDVILNVAKTIPAFVLMGFVFKQYSKERNLQEEYAFKAAVANTIKAYSDLLKGEDTKENVSRQKMLSDVVIQVQAPPKLYIESSGKIFSFSTKGLSDSIKNLNETISHLKP
ncbi:MAG TPA: hypothetical protein VNZ49_09055 [Bacteroidia bacterium]|jgi:hypothetical protein|nr:hypothetical protein [Bacteroidia bacterium]